MSSQRVHSLLLTLFLALWSQSWRLVESGHSSSADFAANPPRVKAASLGEYKELSLNDPAYLDWVRGNIHAIVYDTDEAFYTQAWGTVRASEPKDDAAEVVVVTQTSVSRLRAFVSTAQLWEGPVTVAVLIEFPKAARAAADCRERVLEFLRDANITNPLSVSFLYVTASSPAARCVPDAMHSDAAAAPSSPPRSAEPHEHISTVQQNSAQDLQVHNHIYRQMAVYESSVEHRKTQRRLQQGGAAVTALGSDVASYSPCGDWMRSEPHFPEHSWRVLYDALYPVNALRNLAWKAVPAGVFVVLLDVDFIVSRGLYSDLTQGRWPRYLANLRRSFYSDGKRQALVLPAFERLTAKDPQSEHVYPVPMMRIDPDTFIPHRINSVELCNDQCDLVHDMLVPRTFEGLKPSLKGYPEGALARSVDVFHRRGFAAGHSCYSWLSWLQNRDPDTPLKMEYAHPCEPYIIALSEAMPRYDERFRGRGQNKVEQLTHMDMWGFEWRILPEHFVLHMPHESTAAMSNTNWDLVTTPAALMRIKTKEVQQESQFKRRTALRIASDNPLVC